MKRFKLPAMHDGQIKVVMSKARFRVLACGRRWGKSLLGSALSLQAAALGQRCWWVAPTYRQGDEGWRYLRRLCLQLPDVVIREGEKVITLPGSGEIEVRTAEDPNKLRGSGLDLIVFDECSAIRPEVWEIMRPALADRLGKALFMSTPSGRDWFFGLHARGIDPTETDWQSWRFPTSGNPHIPPEEIEDNRKTLPERVFRQEWEAEFLEDSGAVFRRVREASIGQIEPPSGRGYYGFVDMAEVNDFNALVVFREDRGRAVQVYADRWHKVTWDVSLARMTAQMEAYRGVWGIDTTGQLYKDRFLDDINAQHTGSRVTGFRFSNANKQLMINNLISMLEQGEITLLAQDTCDAAAVQANELMAYTAERTPAGNVRYGAPPGTHDDMAVAVFTAAHMLQDQSGRATYRDLERIVGPLWG